MRHLVLKNPVSPIHVNQRFGEDPVTYKQFGLAYHNGIDLRTAHGQPVYAAHDGFATYSIDEGSGHWIGLLGAEKCLMGVHGEAYPRTVYLHLCDGEKEPRFISPIYKKKNVKVKAGDLIGYADNTGFSSGDHLHFGLKPSDKKGNALFYKNGTKGAVDPWPFLEGVQPESTEVRYEEALTNLYRSGLPAPIRWMAERILKRKYGKGN